MSYKFDPFALSEFALHYGFHYSRIDTEVLVADAIAEMERGLKGEKSSLPMIPAYISPVSRIIPGKTVIALDAGGTNLRSALVSFDENGKAVTGESRRAPMPGTQGRLSADAFFDGIADVTAPLIEAAHGNPRRKIEGIGFCFSYNMEITKETDGILRAFSKEIDVPEVLGRVIGSGLRDALARRKVAAPEKIVLLNDTVATLLSGLAELPANDFRVEDRCGTEAGPVIGFILGTGFNTAYPEKCIPKIGFDNPASPQIVVCESGNFAHRYMGELDREFDSGTKTPGTYTLEKAASGAYLGPLYFHILSRAIRDGVISFNRQDEFLSRPVLSTKELNAFLHEPFAQAGAVGGLFGKDERGALTAFVYIASIVVERAALLSASLVAAAAEKAAGQNHDPLAPVRVAVEGTTFMVFKGMRKAIEAHLHAILNRKKPRSCIIAPVEQASLFGAAVAALS